MKVKPNIIKSIFRRKGGNGRFTIDGCIVPDSVLHELAIERQQVLLSYFRNDQEWCVLTEEDIYFKNFHEQKTVNVPLAEIYDVKTFGEEQIISPKPHNFNAIFITTKNKARYRINLEEGNPLYGFLQVIDYICHQNDRV